MGLRLTVVSLFLVLCAACTTPSESYVRKIEAANQSGVCCVHGLKMVKQPSRVMTRGVAEVQSRASRRARIYRFPFSQRDIPAGPIVFDETPPQEEIFVCAACEEARRHWISRHPDDPWAQQQL